MRRKEAGILAILITGSAGAGLVGASLNESFQPKLVDCNTGRELTVDTNLSVGQKVSLKPINGDRNFIIEANTKGGLDFHATDSDAVMYPSKTTQVKGADLSIDPNSSLSFTDNGVDFKVTGKIQKDGTNEVTIFASCPSK
jgi:hypothetical protein